MRIANFWRRGAPLAVIALAVSAASVAAQTDPTPPAAISTLRKSGAPASVLPPRRPASLKTVVAQAEPEQTSSVARSRAAPPLAVTQIATVPVRGETSLSDRAIVDRANAALTGTQTLAADFVQVGGDGRRLTGTLYLQRPGKLRFEYDAPSTMEVVSDGSTVLVRDRKLNTSDPYPISQTPLKFLLSPTIDLARDTSLTAIDREANGVRITVEDRSTLGGTSKITLGFDVEVANLTRWRIVDPQGLTTTVTLSNIDRNRPIDPKIFMLNYMRPVQ
jgi:outer membrane lipoprotein-sorting protein